MDFGKIIKSTVGQGLEAEAYRVFGAAAEEFTKGALGNIFGTTPKPPPITQDAETSEANTVGTWSETYYASALTRASQDTPRLKFLFKVTFRFDPDVLIYLGGLIGKDPNTLQRELTFTIRQIDKPKFDFEYEEVNMYNFRTKVLKRITHRDINVSMYDDTGNKSLDFLNMYLQALSPITRTNIVTNRQTLGDSGFTFANGNTQPDTAYRGVLPAPDEGATGRPAPHNPLISITIHQVYQNWGRDAPQNPQQQVRVNNFVFTNPRITNFDLEDMDHEQGGTPHVYTFTFDFDALHIETGANALNGDLLGQHQHPVGDILHGASAQGTGEISTAAQRNPFLDVLARQGGRAVQIATSGALNKVFGNTVAGKVLGGAFYQVGGILGGATSRTLGGLGSSPAAARPSAPAPITDSSAGGETTARVSSNPNESFGGPGDGPYG